MKNYKELGIYDFSDYAEEITGEDLIKINGGSSSCGGGGPGNGGSSAASGGSGSKGSGSSSIGASSGSCGGGGSPSVPSGSSGNSGSGFSTSGSGSGSAPSSSTGSCGGSISSGTPSGPTGPSSSDVPENKQKNETSWSYNPNEPDSDKRYNAKDYNGKHLMTIRYDDKENFEDFAGYYTIIGQYGTVGSKTYDGIGITDKDGNIIHVLKDEGAVQKYAEYLTSSMEKSIDVMDFVGGVSTATGVSSDILNYLETGSKASKVLGKISTFTGAISIVDDVIDLINNPSFSNFLDVVIDGIGFKAGGGALLSLGLSVGKEKLEEETSAAIASYKDYKIKDTLYKFVPSQNNDIFFDQDYFFMKGVSNQIKEIFRGN